MSPRQHQTSGPKPADPGLHATRKKIAAEKLRKLRMENDLRAGQLIEAKAAERAAFTSARVVRDNILNIPARIAAELASLTDPGQVMTLLDKELRQALGKIAEELIGHP